MEMRFSDHNQYRSVSVCMNYSQHFVRFCLFWYTGTFNVQKITLDHLALNKGKMCVTVDYAYLEPRVCFVRVECVKRGVVVLKKTKPHMNETLQCILENLPPNSSCNVTATDIDAINQINSLSAYTILEVPVPDYRTSNTTDYRTNTTTG